MSPSKWAKDLGDPAATTGNEDTDQLLRQQRRDTNPTRPLSRASKPYADEWDADLALTSVISKIVNPFDELVRTRGDQRPGWRNQHAVANATSVGTEVMEAAAASPVTDSKRATKRLSFRQSPTRP